MTSDPLAYITAGLYWCLIVCWLVILVFYWREHRRLTQLSPLVGTMLVVVFLDGARTLLESIYFGTWYTARTGLIPRYLWDMLAEPQMVLLPKTINLLAALVIISVLVRRWFPDMAAEMGRQQRTQHLYDELQGAHEELQGLHEQRSALTHMIVHDMRTPLTSVITGLQTAQQTLDDPDLAEEMIEGALSGATRLLAMVNDLLDIGKMEEGEMALSREQIPVGDIVDYAISLVGALLRDKRLQMRHETALTEGEQCCVVDVDREIVRRVLVNLLGNAIKFTPEGGTVVVRTEPDPDGMVRVSVSDTGPGIPPEYHQRVFEKFFQAEARAGAHQRSTGLGLTFCKMAVEAMGGTVGLESQVGKGSRFWFTLPGVDRGPAPASGAGAVPAAPAATS